MMWGCGSLRTGESRFGGRSLDMLSKLNPAALRRGDSFLSLMFAATPRAVTLPGHSPARRCYNALKAVGASRRVLPLVNDENEHCCLLAVHTRVLGGNVLRILKLGVLWACKIFGVFSICRLINRRAVRVLCYHGFGLKPELSEFRPKLFMSPDDFARRMAWLERSSYRVISLDDGVRQIRDGEGVDNAVVITIDDGLYSVYRHAAAVLEYHAFPATIYVTTYYAEKQEPVFNLLVRYVFWRRSLEHAQVAGRQYSAEQVIALAQGAEQRAAVAAELCSANGIDFGRIIRGRWFHLMTLGEIGELSRRGFDIELHTHRHRWSSQTMAEREEDIRRNREILSSVVTMPLHHYCYPSGSFEPDQWPLLHGLGIESATTLESGLNHPGAPLLGLRRLLDGSNVTPIEFEAQLCGFMDMITRAVATLRQLRRSKGEEKLVPSTPSEAERASTSPTIIKPQSVPPRQTLA
jgi:peptidoglycan/xylan/chitin deacetylase (PgdA/CDA1 family)